MPLNYLHDHSDFEALIRIVADKEDIQPVLIEKDYWIMHCLYGLKAMGLSFELKGGTSLSKGFGIINRFSEDIDIRIHPPSGMDVKTGKNQDSPAQQKSREDFYDWLAAEIKIDGIIAVERDKSFDDERFRNGGIRLRYETTERMAGLKDGILLEVGFDTVTPNQSVNISSWAYDHAITAGVDIIDNRALAIPCYHPGYTFVEKLQTIATKYRRQQQDGSFPPNFLRHYYDVYCLLEHPDVQKFIGTPEYNAHKAIRFPAADRETLIAENQAFRLEDPAVRKLYGGEYAKTATLYYKGQPLFEDLLARIGENLGRL